MAKGPRITNEIRNKIASLFLEDRQRRAKEIQVKLSQLYGDKSPGLSAVQKELTKIRRNPNVSSELDKPWVLGALGKYDIPAEIVPTIIELLRSRNNSGEIVGRSFLTIRQALWVTRLAPLMNSIKDDVLALFPEANMQGLLVEIAAVYARCEQIAELNKEMSFGERTLFDTSDLDNIFFIYKSFWHDPKTREQSLTPMSLIDRGEI